MNIVKTFSFRGVLVLGALCALTSAAQAQSEFAKAKVPFEFAAGSTIMPAGEYTVEVPDLSGVILLHGDSGSSVVLFTTSSAAPAMTSSVKLVFERRDGMAHLAGIEWPGASTHVMPVYQRVTKGVTTAALH
jgi:hypothetical protein